MPDDVKQTGSGALELLLVVAIVLLIGGVGSYLYTRRGHQASSKTAGVPKTSQPSGSSTTPNGIPPNGSSGSGSSSDASFRLATLGISLTVPNEIKDLTYHYQVSNNILRVTFSTSTLTKAVPACAADQNNGAFDIVIRGNGTYPGPANPSSGGLIKQFSDAYVAYELPNAPCAKGLTPTNQALLDNQAQAFYSALLDAQN